MTASTARGFRFGVVAARPAGDAASWVALARRVADQGYSTLLVPDGTALLAPFPALAVAATAAPGLRVDARGRGLTCATRARPRSGPA